MSQEIRDFFMEEAEELFDNLHSILLKNEEAGEISPEEVDSIFRDMHTLKGGAGSVEMMKFSNYTHHLETFMDLVRNGEIALNSKIIDFIIESVSTMHDILEEEYEGGVRVPLIVWSPSKKSVPLPVFLNPLVPARTPP